MPNHPTSLRSDSLMAHIAQLAQITLPVLFLLGSDNSSFFKQTTETLHAHLPNSQIIVLPGQ